LQVKHKQNDSIDVFMLDTTIRAPFDDHFNTGLKNVVSNFCNNSIIC